MVSCACGATTWGSVHGHDRGGAKGTARWVLDLGDNDIGGDGCAVLADALLGNTVLHTLKLSGNDMGPEGARSLALTLRASRHTGSRLTSLDLEDNGIGAQGCIPLADALRHDHATLRTLGLRGNDVGAAGAAVLGDALATNSTLETLDVADNGICHGGGGGGGGGGGHTSSSGLAIGGAGARAEERYAHAPC